MIKNFCDLKGKVAIVTGAKRGIGAATAITLAENGADIVAADILECSETVEKVNSLGRRAIYVKTDISSKKDIENMVKRAVDECGRIDILINNAGIVHRDTLLETTEETWDKVLNIILKGTFLAIKAVYPIMKKQKYGRIVNVSSISGIIGGAVSKDTDTPDQIKGRSGPAYASAKGGVIALTRWIAKDVAKDGIYVNAIAPGACKTEMTKGYDYNVSGLPIARMAKPEEMANAIAFLVSDRASYITGQVLNVDGGWVMA
jgi:3-oxoacyl-[acyl-carrier protein] reductase